MSVSPADLEELEEVEGWVLMMAELEVGAAACCGALVPALRGIPRRNCLAGAGPVRWSSACLSGQHSVYTAACGVMLPPLCQQYTVAFTINPPLFVPAPLYCFRCCREWSRTT